ncbi:MAG: hypothetical protein ABI618_16855 [Nitrospirota bacterium]
MGHVVNGRITGHIKRWCDLQSSKNHKAISGTFAFLVSLLAKGSVMRIGKVTMQFTLVTVFLLTGCGGVQSGQITGLKGSQLPEQQGWEVSTNAVRPLDVVTNGSNLTLNTIGVLRAIDQLPGKAFMWFSKDIPLDFQTGFSIEFTLQVHKVEQPHNLLDSGIMFYGSIDDTSAGSFAGGPRSHMIFFDEDAIGWGDEKGKFQMDTTDRFHTYTLKVEGERFAKVYVDGKLALKRNDWVGISRIGFGDMTNDDGVNGKFSIGDIIVTSDPRRFPSQPAPRPHLIPPSRRGG